MKICEENPEKTTTCIYNFNFTEDSNCLNPSILTHY